MFDLLQGRIRTGAVVNLALAGAANAAAIFTVNTFASMVGVKTIRLRRLMIRNNGGGNTWLNIGTGVGGAFVAIIPAIFSINNATDEYNEYDLPGLEIAATITAFPTALAVGGSFDVQAQIEERG